MKTNFTLSVRSMRMIKSVWLLLCFLTFGCNLFAYTIGERVMAAPGGVNVRDGTLNTLFLQVGGVHGTIVAGPYYGTSGGYTGNWWEINWDSGPPAYGQEGWSAESLISPAPSAGDVLEPIFSSSYYTTANIFWQSGFAPASTSPPNPQLGTALGNCTWYACGRMLQLGFSSSQVNALHGDASLWASEAQAAGISVNTTPTVHSIAQSISQDHVAVVESVNGDGTITVTESSYVPTSTSPWDILWRHRTVSSSWFDNFIHLSSAVNISVTVQPSISGRSFTVDGTGYTTAQTFTWVSGSSHTIATTSPQSGGTGIQYIWSNWSDGGAISHTVTPASSTTYTANFTTQYLLTMGYGTGGSGVSPGIGWFNSGASVGISATAASGYSFSTWTGSGSGSYSGSSASPSITMNGPITELANFTLTASHPPQLSGCSRSNGVFRFTLNGPVGASFLIEVSSNLVNWTILSTNTIPANGATNITNAVQSNWPMRFYRAMPLGTNIIFSDDFSGNIINTSKWTASGNTVLQTNQTMEVLTTVVNAGGSLTSVAFPVNSTGLITITRQVFVHSQPDPTWGNNFEGQFGIMIGSLPQFGVRYANMTYSDGVTFQSCYGFFLTRNNARPDVIADAADVNLAFAPLWDTWFNEKVTYDPTTGVMEYFINDVSQGTFNVGALPSTDSSPTMALTFTAWGWYTGHEQLFKNLVVSQSMTQ